MRRQIRALREFAANGARCSRALVAVAFVAISSLSACASFSASQAQAELPRSPLAVITASGPIEFDVEFADDPDEIQTGLMFRREIGPSEGMLFDLGYPREAFFWMRNTLIALDMLFIGADGRIHRIVPNATPLSEEPIHSYGPVRGVLEIAGGRAAELGMREGDLVRHRLFGTAP